MSNDVRLMAQQLHEARRSVAHLTEAPDAYTAVSRARGNYAAAHYIAEHPARMGWEEVRDIGTWATLVTDALAAANARGFSSADVLARVAYWEANPIADDPEVIA
jgi:predicted nicotinamide N-methyase